MRHYFPTVEFSKVEGVWTRKGFGEDGGVGGVGGLAGEVGGADEGGGGDVEG